MTTFKNERFIGLLHEHFLVERSLTFGGGITVVA